MSICGRQAQAGRSVAAGEHCRRDLRSQHGGTERIRAAIDYRNGIHHRGSGTGAGSSRPAVSRDTKMSEPAYDVAIVGGGIVGAACAAECARAGMRVVIVEESMIGGGATAAGMGHIVVMDDSDA